MVRDVQIGYVQNHALAKGHFQAADVKQIVHVRMPFTNNHKKNGAPSREITMPTGKSIGNTMWRAMVSTNSKNKAPMPAERHMMLARVPPQTVAMTLGTSCR